MHAAQAQKCRQPPARQGQGLGGGQAGIAFGHPDPEQGLRNAKNVAAQLDKTYPGTAASLREGLQEMFTVARLDIDGRLSKTLTTSSEAKCSHANVGSDHACMRATPYGAHHADGGTQSTTLTRYLDQFFVGLI